MTTWRTCGEGINIQTSRMPSMPFPSSNPPNLQTRTQRRRTYRYGLVLGTSTLATCSLSGDLGDAVYGVELPGADSGRAPGSSRTPLSGSLLNWVTSASLRQVRRLLALTGRTLCPHLLQVECRVFSQSQSFNHAALMKQNQFLNACAKAAISSGPVLQHPPTITPSQTSVSRVSMTIECSVRAQSKPSLPLAHHVCVSGWYTSPRFG